ncbi:uncharacterized protein LOC101858657 [Aplysia californica]|uniref:Uncharacterized protein LOC101858657 n=1 Tax=Aplysia californica TaxID=6500 RepID=A0ABM0JZU9_APLCA|nr:uncharacterized protein LOC101858657 [Aplysia californica]
MDTVLKMVALACVVAWASADTVGKTCTDQSDCAAGQCCQILSEFMVVSRRQLAKAPKTGTCQWYKKEGVSCNVFDQMNGYCSCAPGLECSSYKDPNYHAAITVPPLIGVLTPRKMMPGYISTCEKKTTISP